MRTEFIQIILNVLAVVFNSFLGDHLHRETAHAECQCDARSTPAADAAQRERAETAPIPQLRPYEASQPDPERPPAPRRRSPLALATLQAQLAQVSADEDGPGACALRRSFAHAAPLLIAESGGADTRVALDIQARRLKQLCPWLEDAYP